MLANLTALAINLEGVDFTAIVTMIEDAVPAVLAGVVPIVGIRKVIGFILGSIKGA